MKTSIRNKCFFIGRTGNDPEVTTFESGGKIAKISLAVDDSYKTKQGAKVAKTTWVSLVANNTMATLFEKYVKKGDKIAVDGNYQNKSFKNQEGEKVWVHEFIVQNVEFLNENKNNNQNSNQNSSEDDPIF